MAADEHTGLVLQISNTGVAIVEDVSTHGRYAFTFDKIQNYRGQTIGELGLKEGSRVRFSTSGDRVEQVDVSATQS
jgi:hypothetical protein